MKFPYTFEDKTPIYRLEQLRKTLYFSLSGTDGTMVINRLYFDGTAAAINFTHNGQMYLIRMPLNEAEPMTITYTLKMKGKKASNKRFQHDITLDNIVTGEFQRVP